MVEIVYWNKEGIKIFQHTVQMNAIDPYNTKVYVSFIIIDNGQYYGFTNTFEEAYEKIKGKEHVR